MSDRIEPVFGSFGVLLRATLAAMLTAETEGRMRDAGRHAEQAAALIGKLRVMRLTNQIAADATD
jgi:hypothetical protein